MLKKRTLRVYKTIYRHKRKRIAHLTNRRTKLYSSDQDQNEASLKECFHHMKDCICTEKKPEEGTRYYFKDMNASYMYE